MRIAYVTETYPPELNGVALSVERTVSLLRDRGHELQLIRPRQANERHAGDGDEMRTLGCALPMYPELRVGLASAATLRERFARTRPQLVHVATEGPLGWAALRAAKALGVPVTSDFRAELHAYSRHCGLGWLSPVIHDYLRRFHNHGLRTFVPTEGERARLAASGFERLAVVGRGVDTQLYCPKKRSRALRDAWGAQEGPVLLYVGRLAAEKNVELALCAFEAVRLRMPHAAMVVVGDGPLRRRLESEYPAAIFTGALRGEELAAHYASADLFLLPGMADTFGNVTLEALACGLPVVAFDGSAVAEHIDDCDNGLLAPPGDEKTFIASVCSLAWQHRHLGAVRARARHAALKSRWCDVMANLEAQMMAVASTSASRPAAGAAIVA